VDVLGCNPILYSIYALPEGADERAALYARARAQGVRMYFANEGLALTDEADMERVEALLAFARYGSPEA